MVKFVAREQPSFVDQLKVMANLVPHERCGALLEVSELERYSTGCPCSARSVIAIDPI